MGLGHGLKVVVVLIVLKRSDDNDGDVCGEDSFLVELAATVQLVRMIP
jgi:hypothetical protein